MSLSVRGQPVSTALELFDRCHATEAVHYTNQLREQMLTSLDHCENKIGTIDATSCIGVCYQTPTGDVYVQHHDGRNFAKLVDLFERKVFIDKEPVKVHLVGGCTEKDRDGAFKPSRYDLLEQKHTRGNFEGLVAFWKNQGYKIDVQGWALGLADSNATLCSDFVADKESVRLVKPGVAVSKGIVLEMGRRLVNAIDNDNPYMRVYDNSQSDKLVLKDVTALRQKYKAYGPQIKSMSDATILEKFSTTPDLEPPHFAAALRAWAVFLESQNPLQDTTVPAPKPVIILQGEAGVVRSRQSAPESKESNK